MSLKYNPFTGSFDFVGATTKAQVGLGNVDNTSDANKPVSTATQAALDTTVKKNDLVLNVKDYGAAGDGVTDDTAQIQSAVDAANIAGRSLFLPAGTYIVSASILLDSSSSLLGENGTLVVAADGSNAPILTNIDHTNGNSNIRVSNISFDGNFAGQSADVNVLDFTRLSQSLFDNLDVQGGRRNNAFPNGTNGDGLILRYGEYNEIRGGKFHNNNYDGIKLRGSRRNKITGASCYDNGRSGIQLAFNSPTGPPWNVGEGVLGQGSDYNQISDVSIFHSTGVPHAYSPTTSGIYIHTGSFNTITHATIYGVRQGFGLYALAADNTFSNSTIRTRFVDKAAIDVEGGPGSNNRNIFTGILSRGISGASGFHVRVSANSALNRFIGCYGARGDATGTWARSIAGENTEFIGGFFDGILYNYTSTSIFVEGKNNFSGDFFLNANKVGVGTDPTAALDIKPSTATAAALRIRSGVNPSTPNDGDIWYDGTNLKMYIGGTTKTFTLT